MQTIALSPDFVTLLLGSNTILLTVIWFFLSRYIIGTGKKLDELEKCIVETKIDVTKRCDEIYRTLREDYTDTKFCNERHKEHGR